MAVILDFILAVLFVGVALVAIAAYLIFSPKYNTTDDYFPLMPLFAGAALTAVGLASLGIYALVKWL